MAKKRQIKKNKWRNVFEELEELHAVRKNFSRSTEYNNVVKLLHKRQKRLIRYAVKLIKSDKIEENAIGLLLKDLLFTHCGIII